MHDKESKPFRSSAFRCLECSALTWFAPGKTLRAARPRCSSCGSIQIEYDRSIRAAVSTTGGNAVVETTRAGQTKRSSRRRPSIQERLASGKLTQAEYETIKTKHVRNAHADFLARRKYGVPAPRGFGF